MKQSVYIETSVVSYLTARPSKNILATAWQQATMDWWSSQRLKFELFTSKLVVEEAGQGHPEAARRRLEVLAGIQQLETTDEASELAAFLLAESALPSVASDGAQVSCDGHFSVEGS